MKTARNAPNGMSVPVVYMIVIEYCCLMEKLAIPFAGLTLKNPLIVSSSGLTDRVEKVKRWEEAGVAAVVLKSIFEEEILAAVETMETGGHAEEADYLQFYFREHRLADYLSLLHGCKAACSIPVIASINCYRMAEWTDFARQIEEAGADALELNVMAINSELHYTYGSFERLHLDIFRSVKNEVKIPVIVKLGSRFTNCIPLVDQLHAQGAAAVVLFNRMASPDLDIDSFQYTHGEVLGHPSDLAEVLRWVALVSGRLPRVDLGASGGVADGRALIKVLLAGASAAEVCTAFYRGGTGQVAAMLDELVRWMEREGYGSIAEFRGLLNAGCGDGDKNPFERTQFFKNYSLLDR